MLKVSQNFPIVKIGEMATAQRHSTCGLLCQIFFSEFIVVINYIKNNIILFYKKSSLFLTFSKKGFILVKFNR